MFSVDDHRHIIVEAYLFTFIAAVGTVVVIVAVAVVIVIVGHLLTLLQTFRVI